MPHPISPRLPSRYEPVDRKFSFSAFDEVEPLQTYSEESLLDTHGARVRPDERPYPDTRSMDEDPPHRKYSAGLARDTDMPIAHNEQASSFVSTAATDRLRPANAIVVPVNRVKNHPPTPLVDPLPEEFEIPHPVTVSSDTAPITRTLATSPSELEDSRLLQHSNEGMGGIELQPAKGQRAAASPIASPEGADRISGKRGRKRYEPLIPASLRDTAVTLEPAERFPNKQAPQPTSHRAAPDFLNPAKDVVEPAALIPVSVSLGLDNKKSKDVMASRTDEDIKYDAHNHTPPKASNGPIPARVTRRENSHITPAQPLHILTTMQPHRESSAPVAPTPEPTINVTISRIEVRAITPPATPKRDKASGPKPMSLSEYLSQYSRNSQRGPR